MQRWYDFRFWGMILLASLMFHISSARQGLPQVENGNNKLEPSASFLGEFYYERVGYYMENAGDVNDDGFEDFLIGTFHNRENGYDAGAAYLILGDSLNEWGFKKKLREVDARFLGKYEYDAFGFYMSGNGDVNGDGIDDFVIGAPAGNEAGGPNPGYAFLFFGRTEADWGNECVAMDQADASFVGRHGYDHAGEAVAIVGDVNQDGYDDFIIGAPLNDDGAHESGKIYFFLGKPGGWNRNTDIEEADASFIGNRDREWAGYIVSSAGDINGDGFADFLIGAPHLDYFGGRIYLIFGKAEADWGTNFDLADADVIFEGESPYDRAGWALACTCDVNNDGYSDILIGAPDNDDNGEQSGKVYLVLGKSTGWVKNINLKDIEASWHGEKVDDEAGWSVSGLPDINYDGCDEILIGAWRNNQIGTNCGKAYLIYGKMDGWQKDANLSNVPDYFPGEYPGDYAGYCVAGNDANGDGLGDIWISATYNNDYEYHAGKVYLFLSERDRYQISGQVRYYANGNPVSNVLMSVAGDTIDPFFTDGNGKYDLLLSHHQNYTYIPSKPKNTDFNSETIIAYDAALALQAAVGLIQLDSLQYIAADVDQDSVLTAYDAALIARYVVDYEDSCSSVGNWIFNPPEQNYLNLDKHYSQQDFSGIIVGNVHGDWQCPDSTGKTGPLLKVDLPIVRFENNQAKIPIKTRPGQNLVSLELKMKYPPERLSLAEIQKKDIISDFNFITNHRHNEINLAIYGTQPVRSEDTLFTLVFNIENELTDKDEISIEKLQINNYPVTRGTIALGKYQGAEIPRAVTLYPNFPNPFNHQTAIRLEVNKASKINMTIYNVNGEIVKTIINRFLSPNEYTFHWDGTDEQNRSSSSGIYVCRLKSGSGVESYKLLFIK